MGVTMYRILVTVIVLITIGTRLGCSGQTAGDHLIISFEGGEARFTRVLSPNAAGLRAFPVQRASDGKPAYDDAGLQRGPVVLEDGCLRVSVSNNVFTSYLILWPPQYASANYTTLLRTARAVPSMSRTGNPYDNAPQESFFSRLKNELISDRPFDTALKRGRPPSSTSKCFTTGNDCTRPWTIVRRSNSRPCTLHLNSLSIFPRA